MPVAAGKRRPVNTAGKDGNTRGPNGVEHGNVTAEQSSSAFVKQNWESARRYIERKYGKDSQEYRDWIAETKGTLTAAEADEYRKVGILDVLTAIMNPQSYVRVGEGILGVVCLIGGVVLIAKELGAPVPSPARAVRRRAKVATPAPEAPAGNGGSEA